MKIDTWIVLANTSVQYSPDSIDLTQSVTWAPTCIANYMRPILTRIENKVLFMIHAGDDQTGALRDPISYSNLIGT